MLGRERQGVAEEHGSAAVGQPSQRAGERPTATSACELGFAPHRTSVALDRGAATCVSLHAACGDLGVPFVKNEPRPMALPAVAHMPAHTPEHTAGAGSARRCPAEGDGRETRLLGSQFLYAEGLSALQGMGFCDSEAALLALREAKGSVAAAVDLLVSCKSSATAQNGLVQGGGCGCGRGVQVGGGESAQLAGRSNVGAGRAKIGSSSRGGRGNGVGKSAARGQTLIASFLSKSSGK